MAAPKADGKYHLLQYTDLSEAASFVAALSRFLCSPQGSKYLRPLAAAEVWSHIVGSADAIERIEIYMNGVAIEAATDAFGRPQIAAKKLGEHVPTESILLIGAGGVEAWGLDEAQWHILSER